MSAKATYIQNDHAQCISLKKLKYSANPFVGFFINARHKRQGKKPKIRNRIIPGIRKSGKGECSKIDKGNPPSNLPDGEMINNKPPPMALTPRNNNKEISIFLAVVGFIIIKLKVYKQINTTKKSK
jgi:hypothetical protein